MNSCLELEARALPPGSRTRMGIVRPGSEGQVHCLAFSPHDGSLASGTEDGVIRLWRPDTGILLGELHGHCEGVFESPGITSIAFSPDGQKLISGGWDDTTRLWDVHTRRELFCHDLNVDDSLVKSVAYSADGRTLAAAGCYATILIWDACTGGEIRKLRAEESNSSGSDVDCIAFSPDGRALVAGYENAMQVWEVATGNKLVFWTLGERMYGVTVHRLAVSPGGAHVAAGNLGDSLIRVLDMRTRRDELVLDHGHSVAALAFTPDGAFLVSAGGLDHTVRVWEMASGRPLLKLDVEMPVYAVACSPDGASFAHGLKDGNIVVWNRDVVPSSSAGDYTLSDSRKGEPDRLHWDTIIGPTSGGEAEPTLAYWDRLRQVIKEAAALPLPTYVFDYRTILNVGDLRAEDLMAGEVAYCRSGARLRRMAEAVARIPREQVTPELLDYADGWSRLCNETAIVCDRWAQAERSYVEISWRDCLMIGWGRLLVWLKEICDAGIRGKCSPPKSGNPADEDEAQRKSLKAELSEMTRRGARHLEDSRLLVTRLEKQHDLKFPSLDRYS